MKASSKNQVNQKLNHEATFDEGDIVHLLAPGDPREKRNDLKARHKDEPGSPVVQYWASVWFS